MAIAFVLLQAGSAWADAPLTLDQALAAARTANASLPVAHADVSIGTQAVREARGSLGPSVSLGGDLRYAPNGASYNPAVAPINEERAQIIVQQPLYEGGVLRATVRASEAQLRSAHARYRQTEADLEFEVRTRFAEILEIEEELAVRSQGVERLRSYLTLIRERRRAGEGLEADLLRTEVRISGEEAGLRDIERRLKAAKLEMNDLMGRDPSVQLEIVPLAPPAPPTVATSEPWRLAPEIARAAAEREAAQAAVDQARGQRLPHLALTLDAGVFGPGISPPGPLSTVPDRLRSDLGASVTLTLNWPIWDLGVYDARLAQARLRSEQAEGAREVAIRQARLSWLRATADMDQFYKTVEIRARAVPKARDSYLLAESLYRGGVVTSVEVLDAHAAWVDAQVARSTAVQQYRTAEAQARRWGTP